MAVNISLHHIIVNWYFQYGSDIQGSLLQLAVGLLVAKYVVLKEEFDYGRLLYEGALAYIGLLLSGISIAILNHMFDYEVQGEESLWVLIPVVLLYQPFVIEAIPELISALIAITATIILMYSVRMYLVFSNVNRHFKKLPIEILSTAIIYTILMVF